MVVRSLLRSRLARPTALLLSERQAARLTDIVEGWPADIPAFVAAQPVLDAIAGFHLHRGVLALGERVEEPSAEALLAYNDPPPSGEVARSAGGGFTPECETISPLTRFAEATPEGEHQVLLVLLGVSNHDNVGAIFRNAAAFGADAVLLDAACADPLYRKAIRVSMGAALHVPFARLPPGEPLAILAAHGFEALALSPAAALDLADHRPTTRTALLLGAEGPGLPPDLLARATAVRIPMAPGVDSLNVAVAGAIALHHLRSVSPPAPSPAAAGRPPPAPRP